MNCTVFKLSIDGVASPNDPSSVPARLLALGTANIVRSTELSVVDSIKTGSEPTTESAAELRNVENSTTGEAGGDMVLMTDNPLTKLGSVGEPPN